MKFMPVGVYATGRANSIPIIAFAPRRMAVEIVGTIGLTPPLQPAIMSSLVTSKLDRLDALALEHSVRWLTKIHYINSASTPRKSKALAPSSPAAEDSL
jgi:hypothetical protein